MRKYKSPFISAMFWAVMAIFILVIGFCSISISQDNRIPLCNTEMDWFTPDGSSLDLNNKTQILSITHDKTYSAYFIADKDEEAVSISFKTNFSNVSIFVNDKQVYSTKEHLSAVKDSFFSFDAPVSNIYLTSLNKINKGDKILFSVETFYSDTVCGISDVFYGQTYDIISAVFKKDIFGMFICIIVFAIGTLMFIFHFSFRKIISMHNIKYAACFAFLAALHAFSEWAIFLLIFTEANKIAYMLHTLSFIFMFLPVIMFFKDSMQSRVSVNCLRVSSIIQSAFIVIITICAAFNIFDLHKSAELSKLVGLAHCIFILIALILDLSKRKERRSWDIILPLLYLAFIVFAILMHILYAGNYISIMFISCCLLFLVLILIIDMHEVANILQLSNEVEEMGKAAFTDALTSVGNTAAFNKKMAHLEVVKLNYKSIAIVQFDINNLKTINDNLGHEQGDKLIKDGSAIIYRVFGKIGNVYRTGGDEFVCVICGDDAITLCYNAIASFDMAIDEYNSDESHKFILQIAYGSEYYSSESDNRYLSLKEIQKKADANMYRKKHEMKTSISVDQVLKKVPIDFENQ